MIDEGYISLGMAIELFEEERERWHQERLKQ